MHDFSPMWDFPGGSDSKESACNVGDSGSIPGVGRSPGEGNCNPLQYSCLENSMDRGLKEWDTTEQLNTSLSHMCHEYSTMLQGKYAA